MRPYAIRIEPEDDGHRVIAHDGDERCIVLAWCAGPHNTRADAIMSYVDHLQRSPASLASLLRALGRDDLADQVGV